MNKLFGPIRMEKSFPLYYDMIMWELFKKNQVGDKE